ncbi:response regulator transcription factor [Komarekiella sp. 'clone 1']|uniref:Response regulator transcription factor n=1 Tax=Komarekiella delphini-convector SJRDD-AB1 TaxID=2593771 RepID=A0AA40STN8_9NOST|nr:response regulator [Komarekiella delphini-convector]MBD6615064.1 response regulator transcription factor [Komarekiella delphini-convector SJRDD-AB1]
MSQNLPEKTSFKLFLIDCHEICLNGTIEVLRSQYPDAKIFTAQTAENALNQVSVLQPDLVVIDIYIPEKPGVMASTNTGMQLLRNLMENYSNLNIIVQSAHIRTLVRMKPEIDAYKGGFTIADKSLSSKQMLARVKWALQGLTHTKDIQEIYSELELKPEWRLLLTLAFQEGLQDKAIAQRISVSERMVRHYWDKLQNALGIDGEELKNQGKNLRIITQIRAREAGLID